jgi:hypothetical protein
MMRLLFQDNSGYMEAAVFDEVCEMASNELKIDHVYIIDSAVVKNMDKKCSSWPKLTNTSYEMIIKRTDGIYQSKNDELPEYNKRKDFESEQEMISLMNLPWRNDSMFNGSLIAVIKQIDNECQKIKCKNNSELSVLNITITDESHAVIRVSLWGKQANEFCMKIGNVVIIRNPKMQLYKDIKSLSILRMSNIEHVENLNDYERAIELNDWWTNKWWLSRKNDEILNRKNEKKFKKSV